MADSWVSPKRLPSPAAAAHAGHSAPVNGPITTPATRSTEAVNTVSRVSAAAQRARDTDRRTIIETELHTELSSHRSLSQRPAFADAAQRDDMNQRLQRHAANIEALKRELSRLP